MAFSFHEPPVSTKMARRCVFFPKFGAWCIIIIVIIANVIIIIRIIFNAIGMTKSHGKDILLKTSHYSGKDNKSK